MTMTSFEAIHLALTPEERGPRRFPSFRTMSAAFFYDFVPLPDEKVAPEYVTVPVRSLKERLFVAEWNTMWEAGNLRSLRDEAELPPAFDWLGRFQGRNLYLLPDGDAEIYHRFAVLYHLLPLSVLERFGLPPLHRGTWPFMIDTLRAVSFPADLRGRLERAWSYHIWPLLCGGRLGDKRWFSDDDPLRILSHGLEFWLPHAYATIEGLVPDLFDRVPLDTDELRLRAQEIKSSPDTEGLEFARPRMGGYLWLGEDEAREITTAVVDTADSGGRLRAIIDAVRSNRQEDDFSDRWSGAKADFERRIHHARARAKVVFVEIPGTIPVQGPEAEIDYVPAAGASDTAVDAVNGLVWEELMSAVDPKARRIVAVLRSGETRVGEISRILGYANHSPVSKKLRKILTLVKRYFVDDA